MRTLIFYLCFTVCVTTVLASEESPSSTLKSIIDGGGGYVEVNGGTYSGDVNLGPYTNKVIVFKNVTINGNLTLQRMKNLTLEGRLKVTGDLNLIGMIYCDLENITSNFMYIQNYAGWGGFYWNTFKNIQSKAMQVRQAALKNGTSAINENYFEGLYIRDGLAKNNWNNVWIRNGGNITSSDHNYTDRIGLDPDLDYWSTVYTNPFVINHFDFSDTNAPSSSRSTGIRHEGPRPISVQNGFIEHHYYSHAGEMVLENVEMRSNTNIAAISGNLDFDVGKVVGKVGNYKALPAVGLVDNYDFENGLTGYTGKGISVSGGVVSIKNGTYDALEFRYTAKRTGPISIVVRGQYVVEVKHQSGSGPRQYGLGHKYTGKQDEYIIARSTARAGETQRIWVRAASGKTAKVTGFQVYEGLTGFKFPR